MIGTDKKDTTNFHSYLYVQSYQSSRGIPTPRIYGLNEQRPWTSEAKQTKYDGINNNNSWWKQKLTNAKLSIPIDRPVIKTILGTVELPITCIIWAIDFILSRSSEICHRIFTLLYLFSPTKGIESNPFVCGGNKKRTAERHDKPTLNLKKNVSVNTYTTTQNTLTFCGHLANRASV